MPHARQSGSHPTLAGHSKTQATAPLAYLTGGDRAGLELVTTISVRQTSLTCGHHFIPNCKRTNPLGSTLGVGRKCHTHQKGKNSTPGSEKVQGQGNTQRAGDETDLRVSVSPCQCPLQATSPSSSISRDFKNKGDRSPCELPSRPTAARILSPAALLPGRRTRVGGSRSGSRGAPPGTGEVTGHELSSRR